MTGIDLNPRQMLALIFGASAFERAPKLAQGLAFYNSAQGFRDYLTDSAGLALPRENVKSLFDDTRSASDQLLDAGDFLELRSAAIKKEGLEPSSLILYYVGHGLFSGADQAYCFAVRATDARHPALTSIRASDLAWTLKESARFWRKFMVLDCCFSAAAYKEFQSGPLMASYVKLREELPRKGTTLLCSASARDASIAPEDLPCTMFSTSLLRTLRQGHPSIGVRMSVSELSDLIRADIKAAYPDDGVRPEVHSPDQGHGDVSNLPLFPNPARVAQRSDEAHETVDRRGAKKLIPAEVSGMRNQFLARVTGLSATPTDYRRESSQDVNAQGPHREDWARKRVASHESLMSFLPVLYVAGRGKLRDEEALQLYEEAAAGGDAKAMFLLGLLYENGRTVAKDCRRARVWYEKAATAGDVRAMRNSGYLYENGLGGKQDYERARKWYERAAATGDDEAKRELARFLAL